MFHIKICGITNEEDAKFAIEAGADALGLNFYPQSSRFIDRHTASRIRESIPPPIAKVGLFVNEAVEMVAATFDSLRLDLIQLHGDEPPEYLLQLGKRPVMKAFRLKSTGLQTLETFIATYRTLSKTASQPNQEKRQIGNLSYILIDSHVEGVYGGSGVCSDWTIAAKLAQNPNYPPLVLAGGLTPANVAQAIREVWPVAVDTASGVEISPGRKDCNLITAFVQNARQALSRTGF
jgi:phosphoribosylanthranilate isomerase